MRPLSGIVLICPPETGPFEAGVFSYVFLAGKGVESDEGEQIHGRAEGLRHQAGQEGTVVTEICRKVGISKSELVKTALIALHDFGLPNLVDYFVVCGEPHVNMRSHFNNQLNTQVFAHRLLANASPVEESVLKPNA